MLSYENSSAIGNTSVSPPNLSNSNNNNNHNSNALPASAVAVAKSTSPTATGNRRKHHQQSLMDNLPRRKVTAVGIRPALEITNPKIGFRVPILYLERLKDGGFFEAKVR